MGTGGSHFQKGKEAPTAGGASHFVRAVGLVLCLVLCSCYIRLPFACLLFVLSKLCHLRAEPVAVPGTHGALFVDMLNKSVQTRCNCVRRAWHVVGTPCTSVWQMMCLCECGGAEHVRLWKAGQGRRRVSEDSETTKASGRLTRAAAPRGGSARVAPVRVGRGARARVRVERGVCARAVPPACCLA